MDELAAPCPEDSRGSASGLGSERSLIGRPAKPEADKQRSKSWRCTQEAPSEDQQLCAAGMDRCTSKLNTEAALAEGREEAAEEVVAPPSPSKVKRFSLRRSAAARLSAAGGLPKRWNQFYTEESVNQRVQLMQHPKVKHALDQLWTAANFNTEDEIIDKEEYLMMHRKIVLALEPGTYPLEALAVASEDWVRDSEGKKGLDRERFLWSWFELADLWTETMEAEEYEQVRGRGRGRGRVRVRVRVGLASYPSL